MERQESSMPSARRRYLVVGTGHRVHMYLGAIAGVHAADGELVGLLDVNPGRVAYHRGQLAEAGVNLTAVATGGPDDLERLVAEQRADRVIITTPDYTHAGYIVRALDAGVDVVVEKPLTINPESTRAISEAVQRSGKQVVVAHNYRYSPRNSALKDVVQSGQIGTVLSVTFEWVLDTAHGADYFRRWHRDKSNSGGLLRCTPVAVCASTVPRTPIAAGWHRDRSEAPMTVRGPRGSWTCARTNDSRRFTWTTSPMTATTETRTYSRQVSRPRTTWP